MADVSIALGSTGGINKLQSDSGIVFDTATNRMAIGGATAASTSLNLADATQAFMMNRGTTTQRLAITPAEGMFYYDTTLHMAFVYNGTSWVAESGSDIQHLSTTASWTGIFSGGATSTLNCWKIGNLVTLYFSVLQDDADTPGALVSGGSPVPALYRPTDITGVWANIQVLDNFVQSTGTVVVTTDGQVSVSIDNLDTDIMTPTGTYSGLSNNGASGFFAFSMSYLGS